MVVRFPAGPRVSLKTVDPPKGNGLGQKKKDRAALQRVTLVRTSGTLCWTVWSAREQQSLRTWIVSLFLGSAVNQLAHS